MDSERPPEAGGLPEAAAARREARRNPSADGDDPYIPNHPLHPAEADLRFVANATRRGRHHWWLYTWEGRHQREFPRAARAVGGMNPKTKVIDGVLYRVRGADRYRLDADNDGRGCE